MTMLFGHVEWPTKPVLLRCLFGMKSEKSFNQEISLSLFEGKDGYFPRLFGGYVFDRGMS